MDIKVFGSLSTVIDRLNVFLVNKDTKLHSVAIEIFGHKSVATIVRNSLWGSGYQDTQSTGFVGTVELANRRIGLTLPPVSITVLMIPAACAV